MFFSSRYSIAGSGLLKGFTDVHSHLLFGVDDGISVEEDSLSALAYLEGQGVEAVWLTPHIMDDMPNATAKLMERFGELEASYKGAVKLRLGAEYMLDGLFIQRLEGRDLLPLEGGRLLVETSMSQPHVAALGMLDMIRNSGYKPLLAHPERYTYMEMADYRRYKDAGVEFQLNLPSLCGIYGPQPQEKARKLLRDGLYDLAGSDMHSLSLQRRVYDSLCLTKKEVNALEVLVDKNRRMAGKV